MDEAAWEETTRVLMQDLEHVELAQPLEEDVERLNEGDLL